MNAASAKEHDQERLADAFVAFEAGVTKIDKYWAAKSENGYYFTILDDIQNSCNGRELMKNIIRFMTEMTLVFDICHTLLHGYLSKQYLLDMHRNYASQRTSLNDETETGGTASNTCIRSFCCRDGIWFLIRTGKVVRSCLFVDV